MIQGSQYAGMGYLFRAQFGVAVMFWLHQNANEERILIKKLSDLQFN